MANFTITPHHLDTSFDEPRVQDLVLADALGFSRPRVVRELVERNLVEIERYGVCRVVRQTPGPKGGRPSKAYYLNEPQALLVCMFSNTNRAAEVRHDLITVFMEYRRSQSMVPVKAHERRVSTRLDDALRLKTNVDRLEGILHAHERVAVLDTVREMMRDMRRRNDEHAASMRMTAEAIERLVNDAPLAIA